MKGGETGKELGESEREGGRGGLVRARKRENRAAAASTWTTLEEVFRSSCTF